MGLTSVDILNAIRDNASELYAERVPESTSNNLQQVGNAITEDENIMNEFMKGLVNKVAFSNVKSKMFKNPLARLKKAGVPMGNTIEEIFINPATDVTYDNDQKKLLATTKPDGKVAYYGLNRKSEYPVTVNEVELRRGFTNEQEFMSLYNSIVTSLYSGDNIDEFLLMKGVFAKAVDNNSIRIIDCDISNPANISKTISNMSKNFEFPSNQFAGYNLVNKDKFNGNDKECVTFCPKKNQVLLLRSDVETEINYEVLAKMFHIELVELKAMTILVDDFPSTTREVYAILCDIDAVQVRDVVFKITSQYIGNTLEWNFWLHHWQHLFLSMFGNAVAFAKALPTEEPTE